MSGDLAYPRQEMPKVETDYKIHLNFLEFLGELPDFFIFRKAKNNPQEARPTDGDIHAYSLPHVATDTEERGQYWVSLEQREGFEEWRCSPDSNCSLTKWVLYWGLCKTTKSLLQEENYQIPRGFLKQVRFPLRTLPEGCEELIVQPYFLRISRKFGVLVDFHFRRSGDVPFSRKIQQLSLSLDLNFKRNLNYYVDRIARIKTFVSKRRDVLDAIYLPGVDTPLSLSKNFTPVQADRLRSRIYVFGNGNESKSQFNGLKNYGPLQTLPSIPAILFVFREQDRHAARTLAMTLKGSKHRGRFTFPGFKSLFKTDITVDSNPVVIKDFTLASAQRVVDRISAMDNITVPVFVLPDHEIEGYLAHKALFAKKGLATQVCTLPVILDENTLRWSVANIALQIFCKAGGVPWKVRASHESALIIGISQSHKKRKTEQGETVEKYFAFSVLTDNSGLFQKIQVLGEADHEGAYLVNLQENLRQILAEKSKHFSHIVIHTSFRLRWKEIDAIQKVARKVAKDSAQSGCEFAVLKINQKNCFFGANREVNSMVPYEGTRVRLGVGEYLVWFEGIFPDKRTVTKAFPGPTHVEFLRISDNSRLDDSVLLQDLMNLSGANWRGFNAKNIPVSIFYCHLIADMVHDFHDQGLPMPSVEQLRPWFL